MSRPAKVRPARCRPALGRLPQSTTTNYTTMHSHIPRGLHASICTEFKWICMHGFSLGGLALIEIWTRLSKDETLAVARDLVWKKEHLVSRPHRHPTPNLSRSPSRRTSRSWTVGWHGFSTIRFLLRYVFRCQIAGPKTACLMVKEEFWSFFHIFMDLYGLQLKHSKRNRWRKISWDFDANLSV